MYTVEKALDILSGKVINDKQYWLDNYNKLKNVDNLIIQMANYIEPYKEIITTPLIKNIYYTETVNQTRETFLSPEKLQIDIFDKLTPNNSFKNYKHAINGTLFGGSRSDAPLIINGKAMRWLSNYGKPQSCIIIYKDNTVDMVRINSIQDLGNKLNNVKHLIGGIGLINKKDINFQYDIAGEGYSGTIGQGIGRKCNKTILAYIEKTNQIVFMTRPNIYHSHATQYDLLDLCRDCEYTFAISLDGSGSTIHIANNQYRLKGDNRGIFTVLHAND